MGPPPQKIRNIYGAAKIYDTRVGKDPDFPEELLNDITKVDIHKLTKFNKQELCVMTEIILRYYQLQYLNQDIHEMCYPTMFLDDINLWYT